MVSILKRFNISDQLKKYIVNTGWLFFAQIFKIIANALVTFYVSRYLGPAKFGLLSYGGSFLALFLPFASLGIHSTLVRELVNFKEKKNELLGTTFILKSLAGLLCLIGLVITIFLVDGNFETRLLTIVIGVSLTFQSFQVLDFFFQSQVSSKYVVISAVATTVITSIAKLVFVFLSLPLIYFAAIMTIETIFIAIGYIYFYRKLGFKIFHWKFEMGIAKSLLKESWPLILSGFVIVVYMRIDQIMIKPMLGDVALGNYSAAVKLSELYYFLPGIICNSIFPAIIYGKSVSEFEYKSRLQRLYFFLTWSSVLFAILITFTAIPIANFVYGHKYTGVGQVLAWHIWAGLFVYWGSASGKWLAIEKIQIYDTVNTVIGAIINIILNIYLIPIYGILGSAIATLLAYLYAGFLGYLVFKKTRLPFWLILKSFNFVKQLRKL